MSDVFSNANVLPKYDNIAFALTFALGQPKKKMC